MKNPMMSEAETIANHVLSDIEKALKEDEQKIKELYKQISELQTMNDARKIVLKGGLLKVLTEKIAEGSGNG